MAETIAEARAGLFDLFATDEHGNDTTTPALKRVYRYELAPGEQISETVPVLTICYAGQNAFNYRLALRLYVSLMAGAPSAQAAMDEAIEAVEGLLTADYPVTGWSDLQFIQPPVGNAAIYVETYLETARETGGRPS